MKRTTLVFVFLSFTLTLLAEDVRHCPDGMHALWCTEGMDVKVGPVLCTEKGDFAGRNLRSSTEVIVTASRAATVAEFYICPLTDEGEPDGDCVMFSRYYLYYGYGRAFVPIDQVDNGRYRIFVHAWDSTPYGNGYSAWSCYLDFILTDVVIF